MSYTFADVEIDPSKTTGREKTPNPFMDVVKSIALKTNEKTGNPVGKAGIEEYDGSEENLKLITGRIERKLREAGEAQDPQVSVPVRFEVMGEKIKFSFWTVAKVKRERKPKVETPTEPPAKAE